MSDLHRVRGACIWLTGLSGSGKSTTAQSLAELLADHGTAYTIFDGDDIRRESPIPLGFSEGDRNAHIRRVANLARKIVLRGEIAICALISPYRSIRNECRAILGDHLFVEVFVDTPLVVCERRDPKGLYRQARAGAIACFTGIDAPYEPPSKPDLRISTDKCTPAENARSIFEYLQTRLTWPSSPPKG